ncbi:MAG TPA: hypothetical protein PL029_07325 [Bacteroidia bacterium]|nr:hypothetical protein [Bacteroidia bacterium]
MILVLLLSACRKEYKCVCTRESTKEVYALTETKLSRRSAKKWCDGNGAENSLAYGTITCVLQ